MCKLSKKESSATLSQTASFNLVIYVKTQTVYKRWTKPLLRYVLVSPGRHTFLLVCFVCYLSQNHFYSNE